MKNILFLLVACILTNVLHSQSTQDKAKAYFFEAKDLYDNKKYSDCISTLNKVEGMLGKTNPRILNLKVKAFYEKGDYEKAKTALNSFSQFSSNASIELQKETLSYLVKIEEKIEQIELKKQREEEERKRRELAEQKRKEEARKKREAELRETESWKKAKKLDKVYGYYEHLMEYPYGKLKKDVEFQLDLKRKESYIQGILKFYNRGNFQILNIRNRNGNYYSFEFSFKEEGTVSLTEIITKNPYPLDKRFSPYSIPSRKKISSDYYRGNYNIVKDILHLEIQRLGDYKLKLSKFSSSKYELRFISYPESRSIYRGIKLVDGLDEPSQDLENEFLAELNNLSAEGNYEKFKKSALIFINFFPGNDINMYTALGTIYSREYSSEMEMARGSKKANNLFEKSEGYYKKVLELEGNSFYALFGLGGLYYNKGVEGIKNNDGDSTIDKNLSNALNYLLKAERIEPNDKDTLVALREIYSWKNNVEKANYYKSKLDSLD